MKYVDGDLTLPCFASSCLYSFTWLRRWSVQLWRLVVVVACFLAVVVACPGWCSAPRLIRGGFAPTIGLHSIHRIGVDVWRRAFEAGAAALVSVPARAIALAFARVHLHFRVVSL